MKFPLDLPNVPSAASSLVFSPLRGPSASLFALIESIDEARKRLPIVVSWSSRGGTSRSPHLALLHHLRSTRKLSRSSQTCRRRRADPSLPAPCPTTDSRVLIAFSPHLLSFSITTVSGLRGLQRIDWHSMMMTEDDPIKVRSARIAVSPAGRRRGLESIDRGGLSASATG